MSAAARTTIKCLVNFLPMLQERGMKEAQIRTILATNLARAFVMPATPPGWLARHG